MVNNLGVMDERVSWEKSEKCSGLSTFYAQHLRSMGLKTIEVLQSIEEKLKTGILP